MPFPLIETIVRLFIPLSIFKWPLFGIIFSTLADMYDWKFVRVKTAADLRLYQTWDKAMDLYYHIIIVLVVLKFRDELFKKTAIVMFFLRLAGDSLFFMTANRNFLLFFPNFFENFVIFYLIYKWLSKKDILFKDNKIYALTLSVIGLPKIIHEYFLHYLLIQPWEWINFGQLMNLTGFFEEYMNYLIWGSMLYLIPMGTLLCYLLLKVKK